MWVGEVIPVPSVMVIAIPVTFCIIICPFSIGELPIAAGLRAVVAPPLAVGSTPAVPLRAGIESHGSVSVVDSATVCHVVTEDVSDPADSFWGPISFTTGINPILK